MIKRRLVKLEKNKVASQIAGVVPWWDLPHAGIRVAILDLIGTQLTSEGKSLAKMTRDSFITSLPCYSKGIKNRTWEMPNNTGKLREYLVETASSLDLEEFRPYVANVDHIKSDIAKFIEKMEEKGQ